MRNDIFTVYRDGQQKGTFQIVSDLEDFPESFTEVFKPLEMFHDGVGQMLLVVNEGHHNTHSYLATYSIDIERLRSDKIANTIIKTSFSQSSRTKSNIILVNEN